jgi:hypothetical protein
VKSVGAINRLSLFANDEVAIEVTRTGDREYIITEEE